MLNSQLKPVLGGVDGSLHLPLPSMSRLNQTEPATFSVLLCSAFFKGYIFSVFQKWQKYAKSLCLGKTACLLLNFSVLILKISKIKMSRQLEVAWPSS